MFIALKKAAPVLASAMLASLVLLPSTAFAQKAQFSRSKPHVNVGSSEATRPNNLLGPAQQGPQLPPPNPPSAMGHK